MKNVNFMSAKWKYDYHCVHNDINCIMKYQISQKIPDLNIARNNFCKSIHFKKRDL